MTCLRLKRGPHNIVKLGCWFTFLLMVFASPVRPMEPVTITSSSKQFIVRGVPQRPNRIGHTNAVLLDPAILAVTCEQIREGLIEATELDGDWMGGIYIGIHPRFNEMEDVIIRSVHLPSGWAFHIEMPDELEAERLFRVIVEVLLRERANRHPGRLRADLPPWLAPGLTAHLRSDPLTTEILPRNSSGYRVQARHETLRELRNRLRHAILLNFDQLSWPEFGSPDAPDLALYEDCAQLLVMELLRLPTGRACLRDFLNQVQYHLNWQTAFLQAFRAYFPRIVDVEKWWALTQAHFVGADPASTWTFAESLRRMDEILFTGVEIRFRESELPQPGHLPLQRVITEWDFGRQKLLLWRKVQQLRFSESRFCPEVRPIAAGYRAVLEAYLRHGEQGSVGKNPISPGVRLTRRTALKGLTELDLRRQTLLETALEARERPLTQP